MIRTIGGLGTKKANALILRLWPQLSNKYYVYTVNVVLTWKKCLSIDKIIKTFSQR